MTLVPWRVRYEVERLWWFVVVSLAAGLDSQIFVSLLLGRLVGCVAPNVVFLTISRPEVGEGV